MVNEPSNPVVEPMFGYSLIKIVAPMSSSPVLASFTIPLYTEAPASVIDKITNAYVMLIYVFVFIPVIVMVAFSFNSLPSNQHWESFTLDYYSKLFSDSEMIQVLINSLTLAVVSTLAAIFIGTLGAYALCRLKFKGRSFLNFMCRSLLAHTGFSIIWHLSRHLL